MIVNLNQYRKKRRRAETEARATENRLRFGRSKHERLKELGERERAGKEIDDKRLRLASRSSAVDNPQRPLCGRLQCERCLAGRRVAGSKQTHHPLWEVVARSVPRDRGQGNPAAIRLENRRYQSRWLETRLAKIARFKQSRSMICNRLPRIRSPAAPPRQTGPIG
jgi:hypothetical protein